MTPIRVAVPRKGRPLEAVLERLAGESWQPTADRIISTLRYEKAVTKGHQEPDSDIYARLAEYSDLDDGSGVHPAARRARRDAPAGSLRQRHGPR